MVFQKGNKHGKKEKLYDYDNLNNEQLLAISQYINKGAGIRPIKDMLLEKFGIEISKDELSANIETKHKNRIWKAPNKIKRIHKKYVDSWMDGSNLEWTYKNARPKKSRTLYINNFKTQFKLYAYADKNGNKDLIIITTTSSGEKSSHFKQLLTRVGLKGYLKNVKTLSIDSQARIDDEIKDLFKFQTVRQNKDTNTPYQSEVEGIFGIVKSPFFLWLDQFDYIKKGDKRSYDISEKQIIEEIEFLRKTYLEKRQKNKVEKNKVETIKIEVKN